jgi:uncharacterized cupredoxin-like copper-binding protein
MAFDTLDRAIVGGVALGLLLAGAKHLSTVKTAAASSADGARERDGVVTVIAQDHAFDAPDTVSAGVTTFHLVNRGPSLHHLWLVRLERGKTAADFMRVLQSGPRMPRWAVASGGPNAPAPGAQSTATLTLAPGRYLIVCLVPGADHVAHAFRGMLRTLTVVAESAGPRARFAGPDNVLTLHDDRFAIGRPPTAGAHRIAVRNAAAQPHEAQLFRLASTSALADLVAWVRADDGSPPPATPLGGAAALAPGRSLQIALTLERGDYALVCRWPDAVDGRPHGMVARFAVR